MTIKHKEKKKRLWVTIQTIKKTSDKDNAWEQTPLTFEKEQEHYGKSFGLTLQICSEHWLARKLEKWMLW